MSFFVVIISKSVVSQKPEVNNLWTILKWKFATVAKIFSHKTPHGLNKNKDMVSLLSTVFDMCHMLRFVNESP